MARRIVGVDIGNSSVRAVELADAAGTNPTVERMHEVFLPEGAARNGDVVEVHTVASALRRLWTEGRFKSRDVALGMGNQRVLARDLTVPKLSIERIREALPFQVQEMLPVPVADAILDFYPISEGTVDSAPVVQGLLVAAIKEAVMANVTAVQLARLNPVEVDLIPFALARVVRRSTDTRGGIAVIDVGSTMTNVIILADGVPQFVRIIPNGGDDINQALVSTLGMTDENAEGAKRQLGLTLGVTEEHRGVAEVIHRGANALLTALRNTLSFYINSRPPGALERIVVTGGVALMPGFSDMLGELTRLPVRVDDGFGGVRLSKSIPPGPKAPFTVALGLALGGRA